MIKSAFVRYFSDYFTIILERNNDVKTALYERCAVSGCDFDSISLSLLHATTRPAERPPTKHHISIEAPNHRRYIYIYISVVCVCVLPTSCIFLTPIQSIHAHSTPTTTTVVWRRRQQQQRKQPIVQLLTPNNNNNNVSTSSKNRISQKVALLRLQQQQLQLQKSSVIFRRASTTPSVSLSPPGSRFPLLHLLHTRQGCGLRASFSSACNLAPHSSSCVVVVFDVAHYCNTVRRLSVCVYA